MRVFRYALVALAPAALAVGVVVGCGKPTTGPAPTATASTSTTTTAATAKAAPAAENKVELTEITAKGFEEAVRGLRGKVVFVDAWFLG
jgi:hypothetical protein